MNLNYWEINWVGKEWKEKITGRIPPHIQAHALPFITKHCQHRMNHPPGCYVRISFARPTPPHSDTTSDKRYVNLIRYWSSCWTHQRSWMCEKNMAQDTSQWQKAPTVFIEKHHSELLHDMLGPFSDILF